jgi:hypothetical protein
MYAPICDNIYLPPKAANVYMRYSQHYVIDSNCNTTVAAIKNQ